MSNRLDQDRQKELQPKRMENAIQKLAELGIKPYYQGETTIKFYWKGAIITLYPYSGWFTGRTIRDGRGINNLLKQFKQ